MPPILQLIINVALGILALATWALIRVISEYRATHRVSTRHAIVLMACCTVLWLGVCLSFMAYASLGHSTTPLRDSWSECLVSLLILIATPLALLVWLLLRKSGKRSRRRPS